MARPKAKLLVIDDELGIRELLSFELANLGYEVDTAPNGEEGLAKIRQQAYDVVISDIKMPKMDGLETLAGIKKIAPETEVIMATGFATVDNAVQSLKEGAYDFVQKPFNFDELAQLIEKAIEKSELKTLLALYESSKAVFSSQKLEDLFPVMIGLLKKVVQADEIALMLLDHQDQLYLAAASFPLVYYPTKGTLISLAEKMFASGNVQGASIIGGENKPSDNPLFAGILQNSQLKSLVAYPLVLRDKKLGMLMITRSKDHSDFSPADVRNLSIFVSQITQSIANTKLYDKLEVKTSELANAQRHLEQLRKHIEFMETMSPAKHAAAAIVHLNDTAAQNPPRTAEQQAKGKAAKDAAPQIRELLSRFARYAAVNKSDLTEIGLNTLIVDTLGVMEYALESRRIRIDKDLDPGLPELKVDVNQIKELLLHLLVNSMESFAAWTDKDDMEKVISLKTARTKDGILLEVTDNGDGIEPAALDRVIEPFFTTKDPAKYLGLGLTLASGIMKQHSGSLSVKSAHKEGTTVSLTFPAA